MKKLATMLFILATIACTAQTRISRIKDLRQETIILEAHIRDADTTYLFMFRDMQYEYIIKYSSIYFYKRSDLMTAFADMQTIVEAPKGTEYMIPTVDEAVFMTATLMGQQLVYISSRDKSSTKLAAKEIAKLQKAFLQWENPTK
jgi:hypothetical protein